MRLQVSSTHLACKGTSAIALNPTNNRDDIFLYDDKSLVHMNMETFQKTNHPVALYCNVTSLSLQPSISKVTSISEELLLVAGCSDGSFLMLKQTNMGKSYSMSEKKKIIAHEGSITRVKWSPDGSTLLSCGEDGDIKVWSQTGHLRSTLAQFEVGVNCVAWNSKSCAVVAGHGSVLSIHNLQNTRESIRWHVAGKEHRNASILAVDWDHKSNMIVCGGEDCKYRIFDTTGVSLFVSHSFAYPVTSVAWLPNGDWVVVGSFETISLCDKSGESVSCLKDSAKSSIVDIQCTNDSTQIFASCSNGAILTANVIGKVVEWNGVSVELISPNQLRVDFFREGTNERVQQVHQGPIVDFKISCEHLIIFSRTQCHIYSAFDFKQVGVVDIEWACRVSSMSSTNFALVGKNGIGVFTYSGRKVSSIKYEGFKADCDNFITVSRNILAIIDASDNKIIRFYDSKKGTQLYDGVNIHHEVEVQSICLSHFEQDCQTSGQLAFLDKNKDLFIVSLQSNQLLNSSHAMYKLGSQVDSISWNERSGTLAAIAESKVTIFHYPLAPFVDIDLLSDTTEVLEFDGIEKGEIASFCGSQLVIRRSNGTVQQLPLPQDPTLLFENTVARKWKESLRFCRYLDTTVMWATLACLALSSDNLEVAEAALVEIKRVDKVDQIKFIRDISDGDRKQAEIQLQKRNFDEAITILIQSRPPMTYRAIKVLIHLYKWDRALDIATKSEDGDFIDIVLFYRAEHLRQNGMSESNSRFRSLVKQRSIISKDQLSNLKSKHKTEK